MNNYLDILNQIKSEHTEINKQSLNSRVLIVDGLNNYIRTWVMNPSMNEDGVHVGGISGFLLALGSTIREIQPTRLIVVFDGKGGSVRRKKLFPEYKQNRGHGVRLNRVHDWADDAEENKQMMYQLSRVIMYLKNLPCTVISIDNVEADDTIAYIAHEMCENDSKCTDVFISSTDKDFYQLISDKVKIWNPVKKMIIDKKFILTEYNIHPINFLLFKSLKGDGSDNIPGIKGFGIKTTAKTFPFLIDDKKYTTNDLISYSQSHLEASRMHKLVVENKNILTRNYELIKLSEGNIKSSTGLNISKKFNSPTQKTNIRRIYEMCNEDKLWSKFPNINLWVNFNFSNLNYFTDK